MSTSPQSGSVHAPGADAVRVVEWPADNAALAGLARDGTPRLLLVPPGMDPPIGGDCCQDWMWQTGDEHEIRLRIRQLSLRALEHGHGTPHLDALGILHVGLRSVPLPPKEQALIGVLLDRFNQSVSREALVRAAWPDGIRRRNTLAARVSTLRARLAWVDLEIIALGDSGYALRPRSGPLEADTPGEAGPGFEDELEIRGPHRDVRSTL